MPTATTTKSITREPSGLSLDTWAVIVALVLVLAVKFGLLSKVPW